MCGGTGLAALSAERTADAAGIVFDGSEMHQLPEWLLRNAAGLKAHPAFQDALKLYATLMTGQLENAADRVRVTSEEALLFIGIAMSAMHLSRDVADLRSGATLSRAQAFASRANLTSANRVAALVGLKKRMGHWQEVQVPEDRRMKRLEPTEKGQLLAEAYARMTLEPVQLLSDGVDYLGLLKTDPDFKGRVAVEAVNQYLQGIRVRRAVPEANYFMGQVAGRQVMFKLWLAFLEQGDGSHIIRYPYERLAASFAVSRAHIRRMIEGGRERGLFAIHAPGGQAIEILPKFIALQETVASLVFAQIKSQADAAAAKTGRSRIAWESGPEGAFG